MKKSVRTWSAAFLVAIYCLAVGAVTESLWRSDFSGNPASAHEHVLSDFSAKLFSHTSQSESSVNISGNLPAPCFKNLASDLWAIIKASGQRIETAYSLYLTHSGNMLINYRKSDRIFPFHYFW